MHCHFVIPAKAGIQRWRGGSRRDRQLTWDRLKLKRQFARGSDGLYTHTVHQDRWDGT